MKNLSSGLGHEAFFILRENFAVFVKYGVKTQNLKNFVWVLAWKFCGFWATKGVYRENRGFSR